MFEEPMVVFISTMLPLITLFIFIYGVALRFLKWFMIWKVLPAMGGLSSYRGSRLKGIFNSFVLDHLPSHSLAARRDMAFYVIGVGMHIAFITLLLTKAHIDSILALIKQYVAIPTILYVSKPFTHILSIIFISCLTLMLARRLYQYAANKSLRVISSIGDFIAVPLLLVTGVTGLIAALSSQLFPDYRLYIIASHMVVVQVFIMYTPFSKFFHGITSIIVMTLSGLRKAALGGD
jgi:nitrate reductase gamma subunit